MIKGLCFVLGVLATSALLGACEPEEAFIDVARTTPVGCERQFDCYSEGNLEIGTACIQNQCVCHEPGEALLPCCRKGADPFDCDRKCRPHVECEDPVGVVPETEGVGGGGSGGGAASGSGGAGSAGGCKDATECPKAADPRCGEPRCVDGECSIDYTPIGLHISQKLGDCFSLYCDGAGDVFVVPDGEDAYNDGEQCTLDYCRVAELEGGAFKSTNQDLPDGATCPETGLGVCYKGKCVTCAQMIPFADSCGNNFVCHETQCVPGHCVNLATDEMLGETDLDCGGPCRPCPVSYGCVVPADCAEGVCTGAACAAPSCPDGVKNDGETGIDCGGQPSCPRCPAGYECDFPSDCDSYVCWTSTCEPPTCFDGVQNGTEGGVDCKGGCMVACPTE